MQRQAYDYLQRNTNTNPNQNEATSVINSNSVKHKTITKSHTVPSGKYIAGGIENHKRILAVSLSILLLGLSGLGYWVFTNRMAPTKQIESIAILPFVNVSNDSNTEFLSEGISESLINNLSQLPGVKVTARSSSFKFKGKETDPQEVANALGVQAIVMGRVV